MRTRVLVIVPTLDCGGAEMDLVRILPRLDHTAFEISVFTFLARGALAQHLASLGIEIVGPFAPMRPRWLRGLKRALLALYRWLLAVVSTIGASAPELIRSAVRECWSACARQLSQLASGIMRGVRRFAGYLPPTFLRLIRTGAVWLTYVAIGFGLMGFIRARRINVIHTVLPNSYVVGSVASWHNRRPVIMSRVGLNWYQQRDPLFRFVERRLLHRNVAAAVCNCRAIMRELREEGITERQLQLIHNGIDVADFSSRMIDRDAARDLFGLSKTAIVLSVIANLHRYKGHADLLRSLHGVRREMPEWILVVVGRDIGENRARLETLCRELGLSERVRFLGERNDVTVILSAADIHVSSSHTEGLPNNIIEAMCARLPVIATAVGGTGELLVDQETGLVVPPRDPVSMGRAIVRLARDGELRRRMGQAGRRRVGSHFSIDRSVAAFTKLYGEIAATKPYPKEAEPKKPIGLFWSGAPIVFSDLLAALPMRGFRSRNLLISQRDRLRTNIPTDFNDMAAPRPLSYRPHPSRILMVVPSFARGGAERMLVATAAGLVQRGYQVRMLALRGLHADEPHYLDEIKRHGLDYRIWRGSAMSYRAWRRRFNNRALQSYALSLPAWHYDWAAEVAVAIEDYRPTVVHAWLDQAIIIAGLVSCLIGVPRIVGGQHNVLFDEQRSWLEPQLPAYQALAKHPNVTLTNVSAAGAEQFERWLDLPDRSIKVMRNMFWPDSVRRPSSEKTIAYRRKLGIPEKAQVVGTVIRFVEQKDPLLWIETAAQIAKVRSDVHFVLAGYGELANSIYDRIRELGLIDRVALPGPVADVGLIYAVCDVILLTSRFEGSPLVLIEAQSAGRPVVVPDVGAIRETVFDGVTARIVTHRSAPEFAEAVVAALSDSSWRARAAISGPAFVTDRFGSDHILDDTLALYRLPLRSSHQAGH